MLRHQNLRQSDLARIHLLNLPNESLSEFLAMRTIVICPNCGYKQGPTAKCRMCSTLFDYYYGGPSTGQPDDLQSPEGAERRIGLVRRIFRLLTGASAFILIVTLIN